MPAPAAYTVAHADGLGSSNESSNRGSLLQLARSRKPRVRHVVKLRPDHTVSSSAALQQRPMSSRPPAARAAEGLPLLESADLKLPMEDDDNHAGSCITAAYMRSASSDAQ